LKTSPKHKIDELISFDKEYKCFVIGTDEAGRGPAAGPVVAAAVSFPEITPSIREVIKFIDDSKKFSNKTELRKDLSDAIKSVALYSIHESSVEDIAKINILQASLLAMRKSSEDLLIQLKLSSPEDLIILIDGNKLIKNFNYPQKTVIKGDSRSVSIAAASILAKVHRDEIMSRLAEEFPHYGWQNNKGYLTSEHSEAILKHGTCIWHREKFLEKLFCRQQKLF
jgi:ribonuclease HII